MTYLQQFLTNPEARRTWRTWAHLPPSDDQTLDALAARLAADARLTALATEGEVRLFEGDGNVDGWLDADEVGMKDADAMYALLGLLAVPRIAAVHASRGIDADISRGTCFDIGIAVIRYRVVHGPEAWGAERWLLGWWRLVASGTLYRLGRLEYHPRTYEGAVIGLRHQPTGAVVALSADGILYDADGYAVTDALNPPPGTWEASWYEDEDTVTGFVVPPTGRATRQKVCLPKSDWEIALRPGDSALDVHIPAGYPLDADSSRASLTDALVFFQQHPPIHPPHAFICHSWLLDPAWESRLGTESRIAQWARQPYIFPVASGTRDGLYFVFARDDINPHTIPTRTRLERSVCDALVNGDPLRSGGMFLLTEDAGSWGQAPYRSAWSQLKALLTACEVPL